jgi:hypothetical protein
MLPKACTISLTPGFSPVVAGFLVLSRFNGFSCPIAKVLVDEGANSSPNAMKS